MTETKARQILVIIHFREEGKGVPRSGAFPGAEHRRLRARLAVREFHDTFDIRVNVGNVSRVDVLSPARSGLDVLDRRIASRQFRRPRNGSEK